LLLPVVARHAPLPVAERARAIVAAAAQEPQHAVAHATLAHVDALLERRRAEIERSIANARLAADRYASLGWHFLRIEALELANDRPAALSLARALGAVGFARALSLQPAAPAAGASGAGALSERERAVAALVSEGKSNRAIARRLGCSEKSVERCLTGLYRKLGLHSRTELAGQKSRVSAQATYSEVL
jgi:DNA-binding NarL/FixJ family response regulator